MGGSMEGVEEWHFEDLQQLVLSAYYDELEYHNTLLIVRAYFPRLSEFRALERETVREIGMYQSMKMRRRG